MNDKTEILKLDEIINKDKTEVLNFESINKKRKKSNFKFIFFRIIPIILIPILLGLTIISTHSKSLVFMPMNYIIYILLSVNIYLLLISFFVIKKKKKKRLKKWVRIFITFILIIYYLSITTFIFLLYGPYKGFRNWFISTSMSTMSHQYICKWFYNDKEIKKVLQQNYIIEVDEDTDTDLIKLEEEETYENEYEEQVLKRKKDDKYKIIELEVNGQKAYLAVVYDPSKVRAIASSAVGRKGEYVTTMAKRHNVLLAVNGGAFQNAPGDTTGGCPTGVTIINGKVVSDNNYSTNVQAGGLIGMTYDNKLVMIRNATAAKAKEAGVRDGVSWGPFLIVNGKKSFIKGNGGWGYAARTAIGQRKDGIILLLVVNSNSSRTKGADMVDLTDIMDKYGAINAANLDGGTSTVMVLPKKEALKYRSDCADDYCYINDPIDSLLRHRTRGVATAIAVFE